MFQTTREFLMNRQILFHETCMVIHIFPIDPVFIPVKIQLIQALLQNRVDGVVRGVRPCSGLSGNIRCHKVSPCSTRARGSMYPRPARLRPCAAQPHKGSAPRNITSAPRPPPCRMTMRRGLVAPGSLRSRLRRSRYFSTLFCNRALIHSECHQKILWLPLLSVCFNPQSAHPPTDSAADGQGSCGLPLPEGRGCGKGFHRLRRRVNSSFPPEGERSQTTKEFLMNSSISSPAGASHCRFWDYFCHVLPLCMDCRLFSAFQREPRQLPSQSPCPRTPCEGHNRNHGCHPYPSLYNQQDSHPVSDIWHSNAFFLQTAFHKTLPFPACCSRQTTAKTHLPPCPSEADTMPPYLLSQTFSKQAVPSQAAPRSFSLLSSFVIIACSTGEGRTRCRSCGRLSAGRGRPPQTLPERVLCGKPAVKEHPAA